MCGCARPRPRQISDPLALRDLLNDAKEAHTKHEKQVGADHEWQLWYALYIWQRLKETGE